MSKVVKVSVICVYNDRQQLENCLCNGLNKQVIDHELILVDGSTGKFKSSAEALNSGVSQSKGEILIFAHQDVYLKTENELSEFVNFLASTPKGTIVGVAGAVENNRTNIGNHTSGLEINDDYICKVNGPIEASCIDECFFGMTRDTYELHHFDEILCDNWHLYAVEQCLYHRMNGGKVYVFPLQVHHSSRGKINLKYMDGLIKLASCYRNNFRYIWTTCYKVRCNPIYCKALRLIWITNRKIRRKEY